ncbi:MAG: flagellar hook-basal body complex protein [Veillonellales bacterium]
MSTAMYSGVSGLKSQQTKLDVIGNNISNISTAGYKSQRVSFSDILSQTISAATGPSTSSNRGGTNPEQIGLGVSVSSVDTNMTTGSTQSTGDTMDVSIGGDGFFIVQSGTGSNYEFTRAGNFGVDKNGNLTVNGLKVCGWEKYSTDSSGSTTYDTQTTVEPLNLFSDSVNGNKKVIAPEATTTETLSGNLDPTKTAHGTGLSTIGTVPTTADSTTTMTVYDSEGNSHDIQVKMYKCYTDASTGGTETGNVALTSTALTVSSSANTIKLKVDGDTTGVDISVAAGTYSSASDLVKAVNSAINATSLSGKVTASLDSNNHLVFMSASTGTASTVTVAAGGSNDGLAALVGTTGTSTTTGSTGTGNTSWFWQAVPGSSDLTIADTASGYIEFDSKGKLITTDTTNFNTTPSITLKPDASIGSGSSSVKLDMSSLSTYTTSTTSSVTASGDGYAAGELSDVSIGSDGIITGSYSNGKKQSLAMIALAAFTNPAGLEKVGNNLYETTTNSGNFTGGVEAGSGGTGTLSSGTLEGSNVDLAEQFSDMMVTERAYQANSKVITTSDSMMETLINMIR